MAEQLNQLMSEAMAAHQRGDLASAKRGYQQVLSAAPDNVDATQLLALVAYQARDFEAAEVFYNKAISLDPNHATALHNYARLRESQGRAQDALDLYQRASEANPKNADTLFALSNMLTAVGLFEEAEARYRETLAVDEGYAPAWRQLVKLKQFEEIDDDVIAMEQAINASGTPARAKAHLGFGLGKAYEDLGKYDRAFSNLKKANEAQRSLLRFDINQWDAEVSRTIDGFSAAVFDRDDQLADPTPRPVFILGLPRSGTTLVEQILASHSQVYGGGELQSLQLAIMKNMDVRRFPSNVKDLTPDALTAMAEHYVRETGGLSGGAAFVTDKKPDNFKVIGMIRLIFPQAIVIHCTRDPLDNGLSLYKNFFADSGPFYSYDQVEIARYWHGYSRLMSHWHELLPGFVHDVSYEALVQNPKAETERLLAICGLEVEPACFASHELSRGVQTASAVQVRQPIYQGSAGLSEKYREFLGPMIDALSAG